VTQRLTCIVQKLNSMKCVGGSFAGVWGGPTMTNIALCMALIRWGEAMQKNYVRKGKVTGRRAWAFYCALRTKVQKGPENNRKARREAAAVIRRARRGNLFVL
jgi:hypothetical protein